MNHDVARLPKWAQRRIKILERKFLEAEERAETLRQQLSGEKETKVIANYYHDEEKQFLPDRTEIRFVLGDKSENYIEVSVRHGLLLIRGNRSILLHPEASNSIYAGVNVI